MAGRARKTEAFDPHRIEKSRWKLQVSQTEMAWLFAVDISAYHRWRKGGLVRFPLVVMLAKLLERAIENGGSIEEMRRQMGVELGPDGIPMRRNATDRTDEQRKRAWAFIASRAYDWSELATAPLQATVR